MSGITQAPYTEADAKAYCATRGYSLVQWSGRAAAKSTFRCEKGHEWSTTFTSLRTGRRCPTCAGRAPITEERVRELCEERSFELVEFGGNGTHTHSIFRCRLGHEWRAKYGNLKGRNSGCPHCSGKAKISEEQVREHCHGRGFELVRWGGNLRSKSLFRCSLGHEWLTMASHVLEGHGCRVCGGTAPVKEDDARAFCESVGVKLVSYGGRSHAISTFECGEGHLWKASFHNLKTAGSRCPKCGSRYVFEGISFDSGWELCFYLFHKALGSNITRLEKTKYFLYEFDGKRRKWFPDFVIVHQDWFTKPKRTVFYEIKPDDGGLSPPAVCEAKRKAHPEIVWVGDTEIAKMQKVVKKVFGDISVYKESRCKRAE